MLHVVTLRVAPMNETLDSQIIITGPVNGKLGELSRKVNYKILCSQNFNTGQMELVYYIPESMEKQRDVLLLIQMLKAEKISGVWNIRINENDRSGVKIISEFIQIPSVVLDSIFVFHGSFYVYLRFNKSDIEKISGIILDRLAVEEGYSIEYLGESMGLLDTMKTISRELSLYVLSVESLPPQNELEHDNNPMGKKWRRVIKSLSPDNLINAVYVTEDKVSVPGFTPINKNLNMYIGSVKNPLLVHLNREFSQNGIVTFSRTQSIDNSTFRMSFIIPSDQASQAVRIMGNMFRMFPDWNCHMSFAAGLKDVVADNLIPI